MTVKSILFKMKIKGNGVVNYDSNDQKVIYNNTNLFHKMKAGEKNQFGNQGYAKKSMYQVGENIDYKLKISSNCLRQNIFREDIPIQASQIVNDPITLISALASPGMLLRGYMLADSVNPFKRTGVLNIDSAEQTCGAVSMIETFSKSGMKNQDGATSDNTFFKKETVGNIEYSSKGTIDLMQLQYVSCDNVFDRLAFNPDLFKLYKQLLQTHMENFDSELGYFKMSTSVNDIPELGFKMTNENMVFLVKSLFERLLKLNITRAGGSAQISELVYKLVYDPIDDTFDSEDGWITLKKRADLNTIDFEAQDFFNLEDQAKAIALREAIIADYSSKNNAKKKEKADEVKAKATAKAEKELKSPKSK